MCASPSQKWLWVLLIVGGPWSLTQAEAHAGSIALRVFAGGVHLPLKEWSDFFGQTSDGYYRQDRFNLYTGGTIHYRLRSHHAVSVGIEVLKTSPSLRISQRLIDEQGNDLGPFITVTHWKMQGIPLTVGYEYTFGVDSSHWAPVVGVGGSYWVSQVEGQTTVLSPPTGVASPPPLKRTGKGYGLQVSIGVRLQVTRHLVGIPQLRYRYANGMAFSGRKQDIDVEFTGIDGSVGVFLG